MKEYKFPYYNEMTNQVNWSELDSYEWIQDMKSTIQDKIFHQEGNVYIHTKMVVDELLNLSEFKSLTTQEKHILVTAAIFHDIEKRSTTIIENDERITSKGHAIKGAKTANYILYKDFNIPFNIRYQIIQLIKYHSKPLWWEESTDSNYYVIKLSLLLNNKHLIILSKADILGRISNDKQKQLESLEYYKELCLDNDCYDKQKTFKSELSRDYYINHGGYPDIDIFDNTKSYVKILCGIAGVGKDTFLSSLSNFNIISLDNIRKKLKIKHGDKKGTGKVIQMAKQRAKYFLNNGENFVWNATNLTKNDREKLIKLFKPYNPFIEIIYLEVDYSTLIKQNKNRNDIELISLNIIDKMIKKIELPEMTETMKLSFKIRYNENNKKYI